MSTPVTKKPPFTTAGQEYLAALTEWLQDTRLMSEAVYRLYNDYNKTSKVVFSPASWPKPPKKQEGLPPLKEFTMSPTTLSERTAELLKNLWSTRFVFLETLWEEYLEELVKELRHKDTKLFEPFCEKEFMAEIVRDVITERLVSVEEIKDEVATRFAAGLTRQPWEEQWKQLRRLNIGLSEKGDGLAWFSKLDLYFEMRNCIIHRHGKVSPALKRKDAYVAAKGMDSLELWPNHLDFYRHQFIDCLLHIEERIRAKYSPVVSPKSKAMSGAAVTPSHTGN
jgi:hypothetical protein